MRKPWTEKELQILKNMFPNNYTTEVCKKLNRSYSSVVGQAYLLGVHKSNAFRKMELDRQAKRLTQVGANSRFPKGHKPANKGVKLSAEVYEKCKPTMFKKGQTPHNTKYDGHERITKDGFVEVRVRMGKYVLKHRLVWEQAHGEIPPGHIVSFKDRNKLNTSLENLQLLTLRENMLRNSIQRFSPELQSTIKLVSKLKKTINEKQN